MKGRKPKLTRELIKKAARLLRAGNYAEIVADVLGIGRTTYFRWLQEADERGGLYREFRDAVERASAEAERDAVAVIVKPKSPEHAKWFLERRFPSRWGKKERVEDAEKPPPVIKFIFTGDSEPEKFPYRDESGIPPPVTANLQ
jgi:hypothetical protein